MELSITENELVLRDTDTQELIERYPMSHIDSVQDVNDDPMLRSVLVFSTMQTPEKYAAVHLFQCDKVPVSQTDVLQIREDNCMSSCRQHISCDSIF